MDELYHFGVKGMKWGVRRQRNSTSSGSSKRLSSKTSDKAKAKAARKQSKIDAKIQNKKNQEKWKAERKKFNETKNKGRHVVNFLLNGPAGSYAYNSMRASGHTRAQSEAAVLASGLIAGPLGNVVVSSVAANNYKKANYK